MKTFLLSITLFIGSLCFSQSSVQNIFIITTDGYRWQELFNGADSVLINDPSYVMDTSLIKQLFWDNDPEIRRKKLMPFFWSVIASHGQLYGNRQNDSKVDVKNIYKISYPGYDEILNGYADPLPKLNLPFLNNNVSLLEYFNKTEKYKGKVAAFTSWNLFHYILNDKRNKMILNSGYEQLQFDFSETTQIINSVQSGVNDKGHTRYDLLTFLSAKEYILKNHPKVVFLGLGETDEMAHQNKYDDYLKAGNEFDRMVGELWYYVQTDPFYRNNTTFIITTDHGRGSKPSKWHTHNFLTKGSGEVWLALLGKGISPLGEIKANKIIYQQQLAATIADLLGEPYLPKHPVASPIPLPLFPPVSSNGVVSGTLLNHSNETHGN